MRLHPLRALLAVPPLCVLSTATACAAPGRPEVDLPSPKRELKLPPKGPAVAVFAAGCFWCVEGAFERIAGVTEVVSGYAGGSAASAHYDQVSSGSTDHAEAVRVTFDPNRVSYGQLLQVFFTIHDPTTKDRQGPDYGRQYRSAFFVSSAEERAVALAYIRQLDEAGLLGRPIVTTVEDLDRFYPAEDYHQDYVRKHPDHPYIRAWFPAKEKKLRAHLRALLRPDAR